MTSALHLALLAHRGAGHTESPAEPGRPPSRPLAPENTLRAFALGFDEGADGLECDLRLTADGVPVVFHDDTLARMTGDPRPLAQVTSAELATLRAQGEPIPTLAALVAFLRDRPVAGPRPIANLELKPLVRPAELVAAVRPHLAALAEVADLVLSSFDPRALAMLAAGPLPPHRLALLFDDLAGLKALAYLPPVDLHPPSALATPHNLREWSATHRVFRIWTVDDPADAQRLVALADAQSSPVTALITNRPRALRAGLSQSSS